MDNASQDFLLLPRPDQVVSSNALLDTTEKVQGQNLWNGAVQDRGASHARTTAKFDFWVYEPFEAIQRKHTDSVMG